MSVKLIRISIVMVLVFTLFSMVGVAYAQEEHNHMHVSIDVKPGSYPNPINLKSKGLIPVALFGNSEFDVSQVNTASVTFGPIHHMDTGALAVKFRSEDVNLDGYPDMLFFFKPVATGLQPSDTTACLYGTLLDGSHFCGHDEVRVIS